jgi:hypothetical protein
LFRWYAKRANDFPDETLTQLTDLKLSMLGTRNKPHLKTKAAESYGLLLFALDLLQDNLAKIPNAKTYLTTRSEIVNILKIMKREGEVLSLQAYQDSGTNYLVFHVFWPRAPYSWYEIVLTTSSGTPPKNQ